jgi:hypothetical protein
MLNLEQKVFLTMVLILAPLKPLYSIASLAGVSWQAVPIVQTVSGGSITEFAPDHTTQIAILTHPEVSRLNKNDDTTDNATAASLSNLAERVAQDSSLQDAAIMALRRALGARETNTVIRRGRFTDEIRLYIETYRGLSNTATLTNLQSRYSSARTELLDARLPDSIEELVTALESLQ